MRAVVVSRPGPPEVLEIRDMPLPRVSPGWVLVRIKAFGLNRSELFTRQGHSGTAVQFPRVLGIECVGVVEDPSDSGLASGQTVAAAMGGMGRAFDGGYAEYCLLPVTQVMPLETVLPWHELAAIPETYLTAWGCLVDGLAVKAGNRVVVRGGTSALGMATVALAKNLGCSVIATTRSAIKVGALIAVGADHVLIDQGTLAAEIKSIFADGATGVLDLVGTGTLVDSLNAAAPQGVVCMAGMLGGQWAFDHFEPVVAIPSTVRLTAYTTHGVTAANSTQRLQHLLRQIEAKRLPINIARTFRLDEIIEAHRYMESNQAIGKLVVAVN